MAQFTWDVFKIIKFAVTEPYIHKTLWQKEIG